MKAQDLNFKVGDAVAIKLNEPTWMVRIITADMSDGNIRVYWEKAAD